MQIYIKSSELLNNLKIKQILTLRQDRSVSEVTRLRTRRPRFSSWRERWDLFSSPPRLYRRWVPANLLSSGYRELFSWCRGAGTWNWQL